MASKRNPEKKKWTVACARQNLPSLLAAAVHEPQAIYKRKRWVATVVEPAVAARLAGSTIDAPKKSLGETFVELRAICRDEQYELPAIKRRDRSNAFSERSK